MISAQLLKRLSFFISIVIICAITMLYFIGKWDHNSRLIELYGITSHDDQTPLGQKIQSDDYKYEIKEFDKRFNEVKECLGYFYSDIPTNLYIVLKKRITFFKCTAHQNGCSGSLEFMNNGPTIIVSEDLLSLNHEYVHYIKFIEEGDPDRKHLSSDFNKCGKSKIWNSTH